MTRVATWRRDHPDLVLPVWPMRGPSISLCCDASDAGARAVASCDHACPGGLRRHSPSWSGSRGHGSCSCRLRSRPLLLQSQLRVKLLPRRPLGPSEVTTHPAAASTAVCAGDDADVSRRRVFDPPPVNKVEASPALSQAGLMPSEGASSCHEILLPASPARS